MSDHPETGVQTEAGPQPEAAPRPRWWRWLGLRRREGRWLRVAPTRWGWLLLLLVAGGLGSAGFMEYSMQPDFCRSCHIMEPYYQAWHQSTHRNVPCADCHFEPGFRKTVQGKFEASSQAAKFLTGTYGSKPHAEVRDASCLRSGCHERRVLEGKVNWTVQTKRGDDITIRFDHAPHLGEMRRGKELRCVSCHSQMVQGQHIVVTLDTCFLCHFKDMRQARDEDVLGGCRSCHDAPQSEIQLATGTFLHADYIDRGVSCDNCHTEAIAGDGEVPKQQCWTCHNKPNQLARYGETAFLHRTHVSEHKVECSSCHLQITHELHATELVEVDPTHLAGTHFLRDAGSCGQCHEQSHNAPQQLYKGVGGRGVPDMPSRMYLAQVDCVGCHEVPKHGSEVAQAAGQTYRAAQQACDECHGSRYGDQLDQWKAQLQDHLDRTEIDLIGARAAMAQATLDPAQELTLRRLLDDADHNLRLVQLGHGVHNEVYAQALLSHAQANCRQILASLLPASVSVGSTAHAPAAE